MRQYEAHPFSTDPEHDYPASASPTSNSPSVRLARSTSRSIPSTTSSNSGVVDLNRGRYHPSNYKPVATVVAPPIDNSSPSTAHLEISSARKRPAFERRTTGHQQDRITQAKLAGPPVISAHIESGRNVLVSSPRIQPLDSPGWITPFEMDESAGCVEARTSVPHMGTGEEIVQIIKKQGKELHLQLAPSRKSHGG